MKRLFLLGLFLMLLSACGSDKMSMSDLSLLDDENIAVDSFYTNQPNFQISGEITGVKDPFTLTANWYYLGDEEEMLIASIDQEIPSGDQSFLLEIMSPYQGWPSGDYKVEILRGEELMQELTYQVKEEVGNIHPAFLVGTYYFEQAIPDSPVNILQHYYELHADGSFLEYHSWSSKTLSQSSYGTSEGEWEYVDGELRFYYNEARTWHYTYLIQGNKIVGADNYWTDVTLVFSKSWMEE